MEQGQPREPFNLPPNEVTTLLRKLAQGDRAAQNPLFELTYQTLKMMAVRQMRNERAGHLLQPTALVHEAFLKLFRRQTVELNDRLHFYATASDLMRQILVDISRQEKAVKRGGAAAKLSLEEGITIPARRTPHYDDLDEALSRLEKVSARASRVVTLRFFGGLTETEIAQLLQVSERTVKRDWKTARAWLRGALAPHLQGNVSLFDDEEDDGLAAAATV